MGLSSTIPAPPKGFVLDDEGAIPPPPKGFALDADQSPTSGPVTLNQRRPSWSGSVPPAPTPTPSFWKRAAGTVAGAVTGDLGYESGTPVAETPAVKTTTGLEHITTPGERVRGGLELANVAGEASSPVIGPAVLENPIGMARGMVEAAAASKVAEKGSQALGARPEVQQQASNLAWLLPMLLRAGINPEVQHGHNVETGNPAAQVTTRGGYGAGIEITPDEVILKGGTVENPKVMRIPRNPQAGPLAKQGPTIEGQTVTPPGTPPVQPGGPTPGAAPVENPAGGPPLPLSQNAAPPPMHEISAQDIAEVGDVIAKLPQEMRAQATLDSHTRLAELLLQQGKLITPDGKLQIISNQKQAESLAQKLINEEIGRQDAQAKQSAKEPVPAPPPGFVLDEENQGEKKPESPAFQKGDRVTLPKGDTGTIAHMNSRLIRVSLDSGGKASVPAEQWGKVQKVQSENEISSRPATGPAAQPQKEGIAVAAPNREGDQGAGSNVGNRAEAAGGNRAETSIEQAAAGDVSKGQIIFARHGETKLDQAGANETVAGWTQEPLDDRGIKAAGKLADGIRDQKPTVIITSDLARAKQTAEIVGKQLGIPVQEDSRFRPQHVPETEGLKVGEAKPIWEGYENNPDKKPEGGESWNEARARQDAALKDVEAKVAAGERPVVLTHSRNLEMELGERPKPGGFITRNGREKGGATEPGKVESAHGDNAGLHRPNGEEVQRIAGERTPPTEANVAPTLPGTVPHDNDVPSRQQSGESGLGVGTSGRAVGAGTPRAAGESAQVAKTPEAASEEKPKYKFGSTQANIPAESEAAKALKTARSRIANSDLAGKGKEIGDGGNHVTVRYGIKGEDTEKIKSFLSAQSPFEATLGKTEKFPVSEHSEGASPIVAPIEAPELHRLNAELEKHGDFSEPSFKEYKPHATVAYVDPAKADRYVGMDVTAGKKFTVSEIAISKKDGSQEVVKLEGKKEERRAAWRSPRIASDIEKWQAPPELGVTHAPDYGQNVRAETEKKMGGALTRSSAEVAPGKVGEMKVSDLRVAPAKFQYKLSTDAEGVGTLLKETKVFNPDLAGVISVWRDPADGKTYVVNGHHRYELAKRLGVKSVTVRHIVAKDATQARSIGAMQNIAQGRGTAMDAAKFFRDSGKAAEHLEQEGISLGEKTASDGLAMSRLDPSIFAKVVSGDLRQGRAIAIGEATSDPAEQKAILSLVEKKERGGTKVSDDTLSELIRLVKGSEQTTETTANLFGTQEITRSLALEKAEISAHIKQQLAKDKKLFGFVSKGDRASELERGGNKIDVEKSKEISTGAAQAEEVYNRLSERGGPIATLLDEAARKLADRENAGQVKSDAYSRVRTEISQTLGRGLEGSDRRSQGAPPTEPDSGTNLFSPETELAPPFYSKAARIAFDKLPSSGSGESMLATLKNAGVKADEIKWIGLDDFLKDKPKVAKRDVLSYIMQNMVQVREIAKTQPKYMTVDGHTVPDGAGGLVQNRAATKYDTYTLPGEKKNYTELLLTLPYEKRGLVLRPGESPMEGLNRMDDEHPRPFKSSHFDEPNILAHVRFDERTDADGKPILFVEEVQSDWHQKGKKVGYSNPKATAVKLAELDERIRAAQQKENAAKEIAAEGAPTLEEFLSKMETRGFRREVSGTDDQLKVRLVSIHSPKADVSHPAVTPTEYLIQYEKANREWGTPAGWVLRYQENGSAGTYMGKSPEAAILAALGKVSRKSDLSLKLNEMQNAFPDIAHKMQAAENESRNAALVADRARTEARIIRDNPGVPNAPFKSDWHELAMKTMLRKAAEGGYDKIGWVTGQQTAERYDLSKQIQSIGYVIPGKPDGTYEITAITADGRHIDLGQKTANELADTVGKEVADKIVRGEGEGNDQHKVLSGLDLKTGGEWAKNLYDRAIPNFLSKYGKKWGAKVGDVKLALTDRSDRAGRPYTPPQEVHGMTITPEMRASVLSEGQPLFSPASEELTPKSARNIEFSLVPAEGRVPQHLRVNSDALRFVAVAAKHSGFNGVNLDPRDVAEIQDNLRDIAENFRILEGSRINDLANAIGKANHAADGVVLVPADDSTRGLITQMEEVFHSAVQRRPGSGNIGRGVPWREMQDDPGLAKMSERLHEEHGAKNREVVHVAEGMADIFVGTAPELSPEEAETTAEKYYEALADAHGTEPLEAAAELYDHIDRKAASVGIIKPGERFHAAATAPSRNALARVLGRRRETPGGGSSLQPRPGTEESGSRAPSGLEPRHVPPLARGSKTVASAPSHVGTTAEPSGGVAGPDVGRQPLRLGEIHERSEATQGGSSLQPGSQRGELAGGSARSGQVAGARPRESWRSHRSGEGTPTHLHSTQPIGLSDEELADWSKAKGFRVEEAGEQPGLFGGSDPVMRVFRAGRGGKEQKALVYQSQLDQLRQPRKESNEPFALSGGETREQQPALFGAGDLGEIIGNPKAESGIRLPAWRSRSDKGTSLFSVERKGKLAENRSADEIRDEQLAHADALHKTGKLADSLYERIKPRGKGGLERTGDAGEHQKEASGPLSDILKGESGEARPGELAKTVAEAAGTVGDYLREVKHATDLARNLQRDLATLDTSKQADILRGVHIMQQMKSAGFSKADDAALYHHLEDPSGVELKGKQDQWLDDTILPIQEQNEELYKELSDGGVPIENYVHRVVKGKGGMLDRIAKDVRGVGAKGTLSKAAPQTKSRTYMALEDRDGKRMVVSVKGGQVTAWDHGTPENIGGMSKTQEGQVFEDKNGDIWRLKQATTKEIEQHTETEYYHSALASSIASNIQLNSAVRALRFLEAYKASPEFHEVSWKGPGNPPKGWKATNLPQFPGYYFEPRTAEVLDDYAQRLQGGDLGILSTVQKFLRAAYLINPIVHPLNVAASAAFEKGLSGFAPWKWKLIYKTGNRAINAVLEKNQDFLDALDAGAALQSHRDAMGEIHKLFFERLAEGLDKKESWAMDVAKALGIEHGNLLNLLHKPSSAAAWFSSDVMYLQAAYQYQSEHPGASLADAFKEVGRIIPEYRVPSRILDQRWLSKAMTNPLVSWFGAYHYGLLKSFAEAAKSALGAGEAAPGRTKADEAGKGWDRLAMLGLITMVLFPFVFDKEAQKATGDEHARWRRPGPAGYVDAATQVAEHKEDVSSAIQTVFTPSPLSKGGVELGSNREIFSGHKIYDPHADWGTQLQQVGHYLLHDFGQVGRTLESLGLVGSATSEEKNKFWWQQAGVHFAKTRAEKVAGDIAASKVGTEAESPEDHANRVQRREILDQLRRGNSKPFEDAREKHQLTHRQILDIQHRARLQPLEDTVRSFSVAEVQRVLDAAKADKDQKEVDLLEKILRTKRVRAHSWQTAAAGQ